MPLDPGSLNERVTIQEKNLVDNGKGGRKKPAGGPEWLDLDEVWAEVIALRGGEALSNLVERNAQLWRVTIRPYDGLTTAHRLMWGDTAMNIRTATRNAERDGIVMTCESGTGV